MDKFNRNYVLQVQGALDSFIEIKPPFTIEFEVSRANLSGSNYSSIRIYNLSNNNRLQIQKDAYNYGYIKLISLRAGYGSNMPEIFRGYVSRAFSIREGVDYITQIDCFSGGFAYSNAFTNQAFQAGTRQQTVIETLADSLPGVERGLIGVYPGVLQTGASYSGPTVDILKDLTGGGFSIDNNKVYCLNQNECRVGEMQVIDAQAGLLGTPIREQSFLNFEIIFEPRIVVNQRIQMDSKTGINTNGFYKVVSVRHRGMISESVCGSLTTAVGLDFGSRQLVELPEQ